MRTLKNCIKLSCSVKIYVPSTMAVDIAIDSSIWIDETLKYLSEIFGGATSSKALGAWLTNSGSLVKEEVTLVFSYATQEQLNSNIDKIYDYCLRIKYSMKQEAIALEINNELYLV